MHQALMKARVVSDELNSQPKDKPDCANRSAITEFNTVNVEEDDEEIKYNLNTFQPNHKRNSTVINGSSINLA
jgi:hypothetical protein